MRKSSTWSGVTVVTSGRNLPGAVKVLEVQPSLTKSVVVQVWNLKLNPNNPDEV